MENSQPLPVRALLAALGFDPDTHRGYRRLSPFKGFQVIDGTDPAKPVRVKFYTHRQLVRLQRDEWFTGEITRELEREISNAQELRPEHGEAEAGLKQVTPPEGIDAGESRAEPSPPVSIPESSAA